MINESKLALKQVFDNFDKDKSGFVDIAELNQIATELEQDLAPGEIDKVMAAVDHNKDGKISF
jgi:Ca2+-binding EF-hand superfamily protein